MGNEVMPKIPSKRDSHWREFNYRTNHSNLSLHRAMLTTGYQSEIDKRVVTFDSSYIQWRITRLLAPFSVAEQQAIIKEYQDGLKELIENQGEPLPSEVEH